MGPQQSWEEPRKAPGDARTRLPHLTNSDSDCVEVVASGGTKLGASSFIFFGALGLELGERDLKH